MSVLGTEIRRRDALHKACGRAKYTQDFYPPGMLHGVVVRSPHAAATIQRIEKGRALAVPGVACVLDATDLPERYYGLIVAEEPILARGCVRYVGEPVALIAGESKASAERAASLLEIEYEPRPAVIDLEEALAPDAPRVHEGRENIMDPSRVCRGDVDAAFQSAHLLVETVVRSPRVHQGYIEPRVALAEMSDGQLVITVSSQSPFGVRKGVAELLGLPMSDVVVRAPAVGGGFGGKLQLGVAPQAAALCLASGRPVQVVCSREDELQASNPRENSIIRLESAVDRDGKILARRASVYLDAGAYAGETPAVASVAVLQSTGPYAVDALDVTAAAVYSNTSSTGAMRGPGAPQLMYATECHMNDIAERLGISMLVIRRRNVLRDGDQGPAGQPVENPALQECLERVVERIESWREEAQGTLEPGQRRGFGIACGWWSTGIAAGSAATMAMNEDGTATLYTGATEIGTGAVVSGVAAIAAAELGLELEQVRLVCGSTDEPYDVGSEGSRTMYGAGAAARASAQDVARILAGSVAEHLEANPSDIVFENGRAFVTGSPEHSVAIREAVALASSSGPVIGKGRFFAAEANYDRSCVSGMFFGSLNEPTFHCHGAEVLVDEATGRIEVRRYVAAHDLGRVLNPAGVRGQIEGGVVQGIGYAIYEEIQTDASGRTLNNNLTDYRMPTAADIPGELEIILLEDHEGLGGPHGAKGIGEAPALLPAAAIGSAVRDAIGRQPRTLPLSAQRVLDCTAIDGASDSRDLDLAARELS